MRKELDQTLLDDFRYICEWWLPNQADRSVPGKLFFTAGDRLGIEFTIDPAKTPELFTFDGNVIQGLTANGVNFTLVDYMGNQWNSSWPGLRLQTLFFKYLFMGVNFEDMSQLAVSTAEYSYHNLDEWVITNPIRTIVRGREYQQAKFEKPEAVELPVPQIDGQFEIDFVSQLSSNDQLSVTLEAEPIVRFRPSTSSSLHQIEDVFGEFGRLLAILMGHPTFPYRVSLTVVGDKPQFVLLFRTDFLLMTRRVTRARMMFNLRQLEVVLQSATVAWFEQSRIIKPALDLLLGYINRTDMYLEFGYLALAQAVEAYHRLSRPEQVYASSEDFSPALEMMRAAIPNSITGDWRQSVKHRLQYLNQYSLRRRIKELMDELPPDLSEMIASDVKNFPEAIANVRNTLTHPESSFTETEGNVEVLANQSGRLRLLLTALLLRDLGFEHELIVQGVDRLKYKLLHITDDTNGDKDDE